MGNLVEIAIINGALVVPGSEDRLDGQMELLVRVFRKGLAGGITRDLLEIAASSV